MKDIVMARGGHWPLDVGIMGLEMIKEIVVVGDLILTTKANVAWRGDKKIALVLDDLRSTVRSVGGAGLAAPQIGVGVAACVWVDNEGKIHELVNPVLVRAGQEKVIDYEACLSIPGQWGQVERFREIWVRARERNWKEVRWHLHGFSARVVQHEIDHLEGVLFTQKVIGPLVDAEEFARIRHEQDLARQEAERQLDSADEPLMA
jgi:peptide deformylase